MKKLITLSILTIFLAGCSVTKTAEKCDTEKKECCSKKQSQE